MMVLVVNWVRDALLVEAIGVLVLGLFWVSWSWKYERRLSGIGQWSMRSLVRKDQRHFIHMSWLILLGWFGMYCTALIFINEGEGLDSLCTNEIFLIELFQNLATVGLFGMYATVAAPQCDDEDRPVYWVAIVGGSITILSFLTMLEGLVSIKWHLSLPDQESVSHFGLIYALLQGLGLFLFIGRTNDALMTDAMAPDGPARTVRRPGAYISFLYAMGFLYAGFQSFFPELLSKDHKEVVPWLLVAGLLLKLFLVLLWHQMVRVGRFRSGEAFQDSPSALESFLYGTHRFNTEERKSYARTFLRKHVDPMFMKGSVKTRYMGLEFHRISSAKRKALGFEGGSEGVLVTTVYPGGPGMKAGIRQGDLITHVRHQPVGESGAMAAALQNTREDEEVEIVFDRVTWSADGSAKGSSTMRRRIKLRRYSKLKHRRDGRLSKAYLGIQVVGVHQERGVIVKDGADQFVITGLRLPDRDCYLPVVDKASLRSAVSRIMPGERVEIDKAGVRKKVRFGPTADESVVKWQPQLAEQREARMMLDRTADRSFVERLQDDNAELSQHCFLHSDRAYTAGPFIAGLFDEQHEVPKVRCYVFDEREALVFSYGITKRELEAFEDWKVWSRVESGRYVMILVKRKDAPSTDNGIGEPDAIGFDVVLET